MKELEGKLKGFDKVAEEVKRNQQELKLTRKSLK
jgi:hypothetical protein